MHVVNYECAMEGPAHPTETVAEDAATALVKHAEDRGGRDAV